MLRLSAALLMTFTGLASAERGPEQGQASPPVKQAGVEVQPCEMPGALFLPTGHIFNALLPEAVYSYNLLAPVVAVLEEDVKFHDQVVLPKNTRLVGTASTIHTLDRVNINWTMVVLPSGCEFSFTALALSADDGSAAVKGKLEDHKGSIAAQIALKGLIGGAASVAAIASPIEGSVATGIANEANQNLSEEITKVKSLESVYIREHTAIRVFVLKRFVRSLTIR